jgi:ankyrin repeat protein
VIVSARKGDVTAIERAVKSGADIDAPATFAGYTALHLSIVRKDIALFDALLKFGASAAAMADRQTHALSIAVVHKAPMPIFEALAKSTLDLTAPNEDGFTALHAAAEVNFPEIVPWLVQHGLSMDARTKHGHAPLHIACGLGHREVAESLLAVGADANAASPSGTPLEVAKTENKPALVELLTRFTRPPC